MASRKNRDTSTENLPFLQNKNLWFSVEQTQIVCIPETLVICIKGDKLSTTIEFNAEKLIVCI